MNKKVSLFLLLIGLLVLPVVSVAADTEPLALAIGYEQALTLGDLDAMTALFADDAVFVSRIGGEAITGQDAIRAAMAPWARPDRTHEIVSLSMNGGEMIIVVEIADHGIAWGRQTLRAVVDDGLIRLLEPIAFRFLF